MKVSAETGAAEQQHGPGRRLELDGLRGVAILLVVFAHATSGAYPHDRELLEVGSLGGLVGVQLFFVLSGYLITGILLRTDQVDLGVFWRRRAARLYPVLLVVSVVALVWSRDLYSVARGLTYTENLSGGDHGGYTMSHTWSLAVEEQFYLVWPVVFVVAKRWRAQVCVAGIALTWWAQSFAGWSEHAIYVGLRWDALLAGCLLAIIGRRLPAWCFAAGCAVMACATVGVDWGYPAVTLAAVGMVGAAPTSFGWPWLARVGRVSYALYLWHVLTMRLDLPVPVTLTLGWGLAELTYRLVDRRVQGSLPPVLHGHQRLAVGAVVADRQGARGRRELRDHRHVPA